MTIAILGPGGVGGLLAGALERAGERVVVVARDTTAAAISAHGLRVSSVSFGEFVARPHAVAALQQPVEALIVATKAQGMQPARVLESEAQVMWSKLVRLNALACTTSAYDKLLGDIRSTPELRRDLEAAIEEGCAVGRAEGARDVDPAVAIAELDRAHDTLGS